MQVPMLPENMQTMPQRSLLGCCLFLMTFSATAQRASARELQLADPTIFLYNGTYFLYGTVEGNADNGFVVYTSKNKKAWHKSPYTNDGYALRKGAAFGTSSFWAPQVFRYRDTFYMAYVANEQIAVAKSLHPAGPFRQDIQTPLTAPVKQIDPFVFIDDDGKTYLYHVRLDGGNKIFVAQLQADLSAIMPETLRLCIKATEPWENTAAAAWPVAEGPTVQKRAGTYYLFYTANDFRNPDYAVGYAWSKSPLGPWHKNESNPILDRHNVKQNGPGHGDFLKSDQRSSWYVLHTHNASGKVGPHKTAIVKIKYRRNRRKAGGIFKLRPRTFKYLRLEQ